MAEHPITEKELTASLKSLKDTKVKGCYANIWAIIYETDVKEKNGGLRKEILPSMGAKNCTFF